MGNPSSTSNNPLARRRSQRVLMQVRVMITGDDAAHKVFEEEAETLAINAHGALILLKTRLTSGSTVKLKNQRTLEEQECHVVFLGPVRAGKCEVGLEFSAPRPTFWRIAFPPEDWSPRNPESRTISSSRDNK
ncbi:MAG TPA: PilZ domain-containing protein [Candidatus Eremiobacteraceae bacterium]|nr:PilZ domain-containing protein [Candidatus Eremiobacteraceae bacterium]